MVLSVLNLMEIIAVVNYTGNMADFVAVRAYI